MLISNENYFKLSESIVSFSKKIRQHPNRQIELIADVRMAIAKEFEEIWQLECEKSSENTLKQDIPPLRVLDQPTERIKKALGTLYALIPAVTDSVLGMFHYPVQVAAGLALIDGNTIQLETGEGKTIVGLFPEVTFGLLAQINRRIFAKYSNSKIHRSVHVMTANRYLAERDARWLGPVLARFGLSASRANHRSSLPDKLASFSSDVVFGTPSDFVFSYLSEQLATTTSERVIGQPYVLLVDEVDHVLIDEARTAFIIRGGEEQITDRLQMEHIQVHHLGPLVRKMATEPRLFMLDSKHENGFYFTELGFIAIAALLEQVLENNDSQSKAYDSYFNNILPLLELMIVGAAECTGLLPQNEHSLTTADGKLSPKADSRLEEGIRNLLLNSDPGHGTKDLVHLLRNIDSLWILFRDIGVTLTPSEMRRIKKVTLKQIPSLIDTNRLIKLIIRLLKPAIESVLEKFFMVDQSYNGLQLKVHFRTMIRLLQHGSHKHLSALSTLDAILSASQKAKTECSDIGGFVKELQQLWLSPIARVLLGGSSPELRDLYFTVQILVQALLQSTSIFNPKTGRERSAIQTSYALGRLLGHPTLYVFHPETQEIQIQATGRAVLLCLIKDLLDRDLWPGTYGRHARENTGVMNDILSNAEWMLRVGLNAFLFQERDNDYRLEKDEQGRDAVVIIDKITGFPLPGRRWSGFLHAFLEKKEEIDIQVETNVQNRISMDTFASLYELIIGMSGTAKEASDELYQIYGSPVCLFPPHAQSVFYIWNGMERQRPLRDSVGPVLVVNRTVDIEQAVNEFTQMIGHATDEKGGIAPVTMFSKHPDIIKNVKKILHEIAPSLKLQDGKLSNKCELNDRIYKTKTEKDSAIIDLVVYCHQCGMPVLLETASIRDSKQYHESLQERLPMVDISLLNAEQEHRSAEILNLAGRRGAITVATQMAGRGVDIILQPDGATAGGLVVISTERRESRRWDRQISGRTARQGDLGIAVSFLSLEDNLLRTFGGERIIKFMEKLGMEEGESITHPLISKAISNAQSKIEHNSQYQRIRSSEVDSALERVRFELLNLHALTIQDTHSCGMDPDKHAQVNNSDDTCLCPKCKSRYSDSAIGHRWIRQEIRQLVKDAVTGILTPLLPEDYLIRRFAPEGTIPNEWNMDQIATSLNAWVSVPIKASDLGVAENWRDQKRRKANERMETAPYITRWWHHIVSEVATPPDLDERLRKVNLSEGWSVDVERKILRFRIRELIDNDDIRYADRIANSIVDKLGEYVSPYDALQHVVAELKACEDLPGLEFVAREMALVSPDELGADSSSVKESIKSFLHGIIVDRLSGIGGLRYIDDSKDDACNKLRDLLKGISTGEPDGRTAHDLLFWAEREIERWYLDTLNFLGKPTLYWEENIILRRIIDEHYYMLLTDLDMRLSHIKFEFYEQRIRGIQAMVMDMYRKIRSDIGIAFIDAWPEVRNTNPGIKQSETELWTSPVAKCICGSGIDYHLCCGNWVYRSTTK